MWNIGGRRISLAYRVCGLSAPFYCTPGEDIPVMLAPLGSTNLCAVVPGAFPDRVYVVDDMEQAVVCQIAAGDLVRSVRLTRDRVIVAVDGAVKVFRLRRGGQDEPAETFRAGVSGALALSEERSPTLAFAGLGLGTVALRRGDGIQRTFVCFPNDAPSALALSADGAMLVAADSSGRYVRLFSTSSGELLAVFYRSLTSAAIRSLGLSPDSQWVYMLSARGTVHLWRVPAAPTPIALSVVTDYSRAAASDIQIHSSPPAQFICAVCIGADSAIRTFAPSGYRVYDIVSDDAGLRAAPREVELAPDWPGFSRSMVDAFSVSASPMPVVTPSTP